MSVDLERVAVRVVPGDEEVARARMLDLAPQGFEEVVTAGSLELAVYTDAAGAARIRACFPDARATPVTADWEHAWQTFHRGVVVGGVWIGPPWERAARDRPSVVIDPGRAFGTGRTCDDATLHRAARARSHAAACLTWGAARVCSRSPARGSASRR